VRRPRGAVPLLIVALLGPGTTHAQARPDVAETPVCQAYAPASPAAMTAEMLSGAAVGLLASWGLAYAGAAILGPHGGEDPGLVGAVTGFFVGTAVGSALGVHLTARALGLPARYSEALGGALAGTLMLGALPLDADAPIFWVAVYGVPVFGAVMASTLGSQSRIGTVMQPTREGVGVGLRFAF
jgi:hypothetical protein